MCGSACWTAIHGARQALCRCLRTGAPAHRAGVPEDARWPQAISAAVVEKLGVKAPATLFVSAPPTDCAALVGELPAGVDLGQAPNMSTATPVVAMERSERAAERAPLRRRRGDGAAVWMLWRKRTAMLATDVTDDGIRDIAEPGGVVDVKLCAVSGRGRVETGCSQRAASMRLALDAGAGRVARWSRRVPPRGTEPAGHPCSDPPAGAGRLPALEVRRRRLWRS